MKKLKKKHGKVQPIRYITTIVGEKSFYTTTTYTNENNTDKTTAGIKLPAAGVKNLLILAMIIIFITGTISLIRYKNIKLK